MAVVRMIDIKKLGVDLEHLEKEIEAEKLTRKAKFKPIPFLILLLLALVIVDYVGFNSQVLLASINRTLLIQEVAVALIISVMLIVTYGILSVVMFVRKQKKMDQPFIDEHNAIFDKYHMSDGDTYYKAYSNMEHKPMTIYQKYLWGISMATALCKMNEQEVALKLLNKIELTAETEVQKNFLKTKKEAISKGKCISK